MFLLAFSVREKKEQKLPKACLIMSYKYWIVFRDICSRVWLLKGIIFMLNYLSKIVIVMRYIRSTRNCKDW